jgi:U3 small nucleolar RNA-associated protein 21
LCAKLPNVGTDEDESEDEEDAPIASFADNTVSLGANIEISSALDIVDEMITISSLPSSRWQNLLNLESIKKRNKPKEKPKAPEAAPFFLPTSAGLVPKFDLESAGASGDIAEPSKFLRINDMDIVTEFSRKLRAGGEDDDFAPFFEYIKSLSPSALNMELESMSTSDELLEIRLFVRAMKRQLVAQKDFELVQAYLAAFLKINGELILENADVLSQAEVELKEILAEHGQGWTRLERLLQSNLCGLDFVRKST